MERLLALRGTAGTADSGFNWSAETGLRYYRDLSRLTVSALRLSLQLAGGAECAVDIMYDSNGLWMPCGHIRTDSLVTVTVPVRPARCDYYRLRLRGTGAMRLLSVVKEMS